MISKKSSMLQKIMQESMKHNQQSIIFFLLSFTESSDFPIFTLKQTKKKKTVHNIQNIF